CLPQCLLIQRFPPRPIKLRAPECPYHYRRILIRLLVPPTSLPESTSSTLVPILRRTARMAVCVPPVMSSGLYASMEKVAAMSEFTFRKRFRSSYESSSSSSQTDLPLRKHYQGTSKLVEDEEEEEEIAESLAADSVIEDAKDEGPTAEDEDPTAGDEGLAAGDEGPGKGVESCGSDDESRGLDEEGHSVESDGLGLGKEEEAVPEGQQQQFCMFEVGQGSRSAPESERPERVSTSRQPTLTAWTDPEDGMVYIDVPAYLLPAPPVQIPPSPEWTSGSLPISLSPSIIPLPISSPMIPLIVPSPIATPTMVETEGFLLKLGAQVEMQGGLIRDHVVRLEELSPSLFERSLEHEQERVAVTFGALWRPVLALESWVGQTDAQRLALRYAISDTQGENRELRLQLAKERRA
nr:hypothetical protein [Tanacetum cinerariifolium]